jgi:hypothetical protein
MFDCCWLSKHNRSALANTNIESEKGDGMKPAALHSRLLLFLEVYARNHLHSASRASANLRAER